MTGDQLQLPEPDLDEAARAHSALEAELDAARDVDAAIEVVRRWDALRRELRSRDWLVELRFQQDTRDPRRRAARQRADRMRPALQDLETRFVRRVLDGPLAAGIAAAIGEQAVALWRCSVGCFDPAIADELVREAEGVARYVERCASARIEIQDQTQNLAGVSALLEHPRRQTRSEAYRRIWRWFEASGSELDAIFDELVALRTSMARRLGDRSFVELGYRRRERVDYDCDDVDRFRAAIRDHVVPLCARLREEQRRRLGVDRLMAWDESIHDPAGNPRPRGDHDWMLERASEMFDALHPELGSFFAGMRERELLDLRNRDGKAAGGFCTAFPALGVPYIFASFDGTRGDVAVFTHEMGHAFQYHCSRDLWPLELVWPTSEGSEVHSMSLELLTYPEMERFFGPDAGRFRATHLRSALLLLPYHAAVDHFQHLVYEEPDATPEQRHGFWREMERTYLPWRNHGDVAYPARGGGWQRQIHIYQLPFYYVDYALAGICALQLWLRGRQIREGAMTAYLELCRRGGSAPFQTLVRRAGLSSPLEPGVVEDVTDRVEQALHGDPLD